MLGTPIFFTTYYTDGRIERTNIPTSVRIGNKADVVNIISSLYDYKNYLQIGKDDDEHKLVKVSMKTVIDVYGDTDSNQFFSENKDTYDIILIDGHHAEKQVDSDIENSLKILESNGTILVHDCNPKHEALTTPIVPPKIRPTAFAWTGMVWKSIAKLRMNRPDLSVCVLDLDFGLAIIRRGTQKLFPQCELNWRLMQTHRKELLNLIDVDEFLHQYQSKSI